MDGEIVYNDNSTEKSTVEYITVEKPKEMIIEIEEGFAALGATNEELRHDALNNRNLPDQHVTSAITGLDDTLKRLSSVTNIYAKGSGLAEFRKWKDGNPGSENRIGYFVSIVNNDGDIAICNKEHPDAYGVTVTQSGFCGYQNENYDYLDGDSVNKSSNWEYAKVCLVGSVKVRVKSLSGVSVGSYVLPDVDGYAVLSTTGVGFRVLSINNETGVDGVETTTQFVIIALVPQNDNIARVMSELNSTNGNVSGIEIEVDELKKQIENIAAEASGNINNINNEIINVKGTLTQFDEVKTKVGEAQAAADYAKDRIESVYNNVTSKANEAIDKVNAALAEIDTLKDITITEDGTSIASIQKQTNAIQQLVARADKYNIGKYSSSYGLTYEEAVNLIQPGYIYVATENHTETFNGVSYEFSTFDDAGRGKSYIWTEIDGVFGWQYNAPIYTNADDAPSGVLANDDLWYCWQEYLDSYEAGTLYRWDGTQWEGVANVDDSARSIGLLRQTADELTTTYTSLEGDVSNISQTVDKISTMVLNVDGQGSTLEQAADQIIAGTFDPENSSALALLLGYGFHAVSEGKYHTLLNIFAEESNVVAYGNRYTQAPTWDEDLDKFVFDDSYVDIDGKYYFHSEDQTQYCKETIDGYEIYGIGNIATSAIGQRISETQSALDSWTKFKNGVNETGSIISQESDDSGASIMSAVYGDFRECVDVRINLTDEEKQKIIDAEKYANAPKYENNKFVFEATAEDGKYYLSETDGGKYYRKVIENSDGDIIGYEKYGIKVSKYASIMQEVDENGSVIALTAGNGNVEGGLFAKAINDSTSAGILADKILFQTDGGAVTFADMLKPGTTSISGDYISSGVLTSNNYNGPTTYRKYGVTIKNNTIVESSYISDYIYYAIIAEDVSYTLSSEGACYVSKSMSVGTILKDEVETSKLYDSPYSGYLISAKSFDLIPSTITTNGIKFDLNEGTIFSRNFTLDKNGDIKLTGSITWTAENAPVRVLYASSALNKPTGNNIPDGWHEIYDKTTDYYATYSYDGGNTWTEAIQIRGKNGSSGEDGEDAYVPSYIQTTYIDRATILSPNIVGGIFKATGQGSSTGAEPAYYIYNGLKNNDPDNIEMGNLLGYLSYDTGGNGVNESKNRVILTTIDESIPLKIQSGGNLSIEAGFNLEYEDGDEHKTIYLMSDTSFGYSGTTGYKITVDFADATVNFGNATVNGLYAKFG